MEDEYMNVAETADYLGVSKSFIYKMTQNRILPAYKIASRWEYKKAEIEKWYNNQYNKKIKQ